MFNEIDDLHDYGHTLGDVLVPFRENPRLGSMYVMIRGRIPCLLLRGDESPVRISTRASDSTCLGRRKPDASHSASLFVGVPMLLSQVLAELGRPAYPPAYRAAHADDRPALPQILGGSRGLTGRLRRQSALPQSLAAGYRRSPRVADTQPMAYTLSAIGT